MRILAINGMGNFPVLQTQLLPNVKLPAGAEVTLMAWDAAPPSGMLWDIIVGHSLGGHRALELAALFKPKACLTLDPRWMSNLSWFDVGWAWQQDFTAVAGVKCVNFTHLPAVFFPGYAVDGGENNQVWSTHMTIPGHPAVVARMQQLIEGV